MRTTEPAYQIMHVAESAKYDSYFPIVQNMLDPFEITNKSSLLFCSPIISLSFAEEDDDDTFRRGLFSYLEPYLLISDKMIRIIFHFVYMSWIFFLNYPNAPGILLYSDAHIMLIAYKI